MELDDVLSRTYEDIVLALHEHHDDPPEVRARACARVLDEIEKVREHAAQQRQSAVRELRGLTRPPARTWAEVGALIGVSANRAYQIAAIVGDRSAPRGARTHGSG